MLRKLLCAMVVGLMSFIAVKDVQASKLVDTPDALWDSPEDMPGNPVTNPYFAYNGNDEFTFIGGSVLNGVSAGYFNERPTAQMFVYLTNPIQLYPFDCDVTLNPADGLFHAYCNLSAFNVTGTGRNVYLYIKWKARAYGVYPYSYYSTGALGPDVIPAK